jgi:tripartite-type tricarboxylate transporter receptor subunit TctC
MAGIDVVHVQYRGNAPALTDLLAGQVQLGFDYTRAGKLRALAVSTLARSQVLPDLPSVSEFVPGYPSSGFFGVDAPGKTSGEIVDKLNKEINAGLADPKLKAQVANLGGMLLSGSPADLRTLIAEDIKKWAKVIRAANIKAE